MTNILWSQLKREISPLISLNNILKNRIDREDRQGEEKESPKMMIAGQRERSAMTRMGRQWGWVRVLSI
jgi:hypothetical protein